MDLEIYPIKTLKGQIEAPPSKSYSHRAFFIAGLTEAISVIKNPLTTGDVGVTINALKSLGVKILKEKENKYLLDFEKIWIKSSDEAIDCGNSGTTLRILSAIGILLKDGIRLKGEFLKRKRPIEPLLDALTQLGASCVLTEDELYIRSENVAPKKIKVEGDVSSQFITALLIATPLLRCKKNSFTQINIISPLTSYPYIKITLNMLEKAGVAIKPDVSRNLMGTFTVPCNQKFRSNVYEIPGDFSSAALILGAAALSIEPPDVLISNLDYQTPQGDKGIISYLGKLGANIWVNPDKKLVKVDGAIDREQKKEVAINCREIPDLFPILATIGAYTKNDVVLHNAHNIRKKESDRVSIMARELSKMGANLEEKPERLILRENTSLRGTELDHDNDHRIAMALIVAAMFADSKSFIRNIEVINDSYPKFIEDLQTLGANFKII